MGVSEPRYAIIENRAKAAGSSEPLFYVVDIIKPRGVSEPLFYVVDIIKPRGVSEPLWSVLRAGIGKSISGDQLLPATIEGRNLSLTGFKILGFTGGNGAGNIALTGADEGERVIGVFRLDDVTANASELFDTVIPMDGVITQLSASDLSSQRFGAVLIAAV